jgi:hypothetical protein
VTVLQVLACKGRSDVRLRRRECTAENIRRQVFIPGMSFCKRRPQGRIIRLHFL